MREATKEEKEATEYKKDLELMDQVVRLLLERFETAQVFVTRFDTSSDLTADYSTGAGNICARRGQIRDWIERGQERNKLTPRENHD